jgi:hypothetical protein
MNYPQYLFSQLLCVYDDEFKAMPHDNQFFTSLRLYKDFTNSTYSLAYKSEYDCMCDYLSANEHKKVKLGDEIVESLKQFDGINAEVWKYVSEKLGYAVHRMVRVVDKDGVDDEAQEIIEPIMYLKRSYLLDGDEFVELYNSKGEVVNIWASRIKSL